MAADGAGDAPLTAEDLRSFVVQGFTESDYSVLNAQGMLPPRHSVHYAPWGVQGLNTAYGSCQKDMQAMRDGFICGVYAMKTLLHSRRNGAAEPYGLELAGVPDSVQGYRARYSNTDKRAEMCQMCTAMADTPTDQAAQNIRRGVRQSVSSSETRTSFWAAFKNTPQSKRYTWAGLYAVERALRTAQHTDGVHLPPTQQCMRTIQGTQIAEAQSFMFQMGALVAVQTIARRAIAAFHQRQKTVELASAKPQSPYYGHALPWSSPKSVWEHHASFARQVDYQVYMDTLEYADAIQSQLHRVVQPGTLTSVHTPTGIMQQLNDTAASARDGLEDDEYEPVLRLNFACASAAEYDIELHGHTRPDPLVDMGSAHTGKRPFVCPVCLMLVGPFTSASNAKRGNAPDAMFGTCLPAVSHERPLSLSNTARVYDAVERLGVTSSLQPRDMDAVACAIVRWMHETWQASHRYTPPA